MLPNSGIKSLAIDKLKLTRIVQMVEGRSDLQEQKHTQFIKGTLSGQSLSVRNRVLKESLKPSVQALNLRQMQKALHQYSSSEGIIQNNCYPLVNIVS